MCEKITIIIMELLGEDQDDETDSAETRLLGWGGENCLCVCRKSWERDLLSGWTPSIEKPVSRAKPAKTLLSFSNARKPEGKVGTTEYGFVFRHYEKTDRYIEQYRENHCSACLQEETEWIPVLGVDVPDPYLLPTISSSRWVVINSAIMIIVVKCFVIFYKTWLPSTLNLYHNQNLKYAIEYSWYMDGIKVTSFQWANRNSKFNKFKSTSFIVTHI